MGDLERMRKHGQLTEDGSRRYCDKHGEHGILYSCEYYPDDIQEEIEQLNVKFNEQLLNGTIRLNIDYAMKIV